MIIPISPRIVVLALALAASGCGNEPAHTVTTAGVDSTARAGVDSIMRGHFRAFADGDIATWSGVLADEVFFTAADPANVFSSRDSTRDRMQSDVARALESGISLAIRPMTGLVWVTEDGQTATATYDLEYTATYQEQKFPYRLRAAYLLERVAGGWKVLAAQYSQPVSYDSLFMALVTHKVPGVARVGGQVPSAAGELVTRFRADIRDIRKADIAPGAAIVTPDGVTGDVETGRSGLAQWLGPVGNATEPGDGMRGGLNATGTVGWIATNLYVPVFAGPESAIAPMRALFVYHLAGDKWQLVQASLSVGLRDRS